MLKRIFRLIFLKTGTVELFLNLRSLYRNIAIRKKINILRKTGKVFPPYDFSIETNLACNLRCNFCYQREVHTLNKSWLTVEEIRHSFSRIKNTDINEVSLIGGEIFVRHDIFEIFDVFEQRKIPFGITTNGTMLNEEKIKKLLAYRYLKRVIFSIHGTEKTHDEIVGVQGSFQKAYRAMKLMTNKHIWIVITMVVTQKNNTEIYSLIDLSKNANADALQLSIEFSAGIFNFFKEHIKKKRAVIKKDYKTYERYGKKINRQIVNNLKAAHQYAKQKGVLLIFANRLMYNKLEMFINRHILKHKKTMNLACIDLFKIRFDSQGRLMFCFLARNYFGSLRERSLQSLINNRKIAKVRKKIANGNFIPLCEGCCKLENIS